VTAYVRTMRLLDSVADLCAEEVRLAGLDAQVGIVVPTGEWEAISHAVEGLQQVLRNTPGTGEFLEHTAVRMAEALDLIEEES